MTSVSGDLGLGSDVQLSCLLLLYLPRRGLIEVSTWHLVVLILNDLFYTITGMESGQQI